MNFLAFELLLQKRLSNVAFKLLFFSLLFFEYTSIYINVIGLQLLTAFKKL